MNGLAACPPRTSISVCSGVGGLDLGLAQACGVEPVVYIERDSYPASVLVARMDEQALAQAPVWDDACTFDPRPWRGLVDLVAGGTPCPEFSRANRERKGLHSERGGLFFHLVRIADECSAPLLFWENVSGAVESLPGVFAHLEARGWRGVWTVVRACDVEAPHERARTFLLAYANSAQLALSETQRPHSGDERPPAKRDVLAMGAHPPSMVDVPAWERRARNGGVLPVAAYPRIRRGIDGLAHGMERALYEDRIRACGNGVHPGQAAIAWRILWGALTRRS